MQNIIDKFFDSICEWATEKPIIEAIALVGSYARNEQTEYSDVDLVIISSDPQVLLTKTDWLGNFGSYKNFQIEPYGLITSLRVYYSFAEIEFGIGTYEWVNAAHKDKKTRQVIESGFRILYDPKKLLIAINPAKQ